ncbi:GGDEF domain-containing protein [Chitinimonas lacunae]|uniref:diguanylate cyclase n=1 Tax=Chitinimonas lacunae TaxID=1963018 RepID=A0ABV8MWG5_9NEIS
MLDALNAYLIGQGLIPHGYCFNWTSTLVAMHVVANAGIGIAYYAIPLVLFTLVRRRPDLQFHRTALLFVTFIFACGTTHFLDVISIWYPIYWIDGWMRVLTAAVSIVTAIVLWRILPIALAIPRPDELREANRRLSDEVATRREKENELLASEERYRELSESLEHKVAERTALLEEANARLQREISDRQLAQAELQVVNRKLEEALRQQATRSTEIEQLNKLGDLMQSCVAVEELAQLLANFSAGYLEAPAGALYLINHEQNLAEAHASWGTSAMLVRSFPPTQCWALRRGQLHPADELQSGLRCVHVEGDYPHLCVPLIGSGETLGVLHLQQPGVGQHGPAFLEGVAKRAALALVSLKTREALFNEATHDPLTGLYNRRHLDAALLEAEQRARRQGRPLGLMMLDLDHFKQINDRFGHDAGDAVLRAFASRLRHQLRPGDVACRYGGEEFTVLLNGAPLATTRIRAEQFRQAVAGLRIEVHGQEIAITVSIGIAAYPESGADMQAVLQAADRAVYRAKARGRNRVEAAEPIDGDGVAVEK